MTDLLWEFDDYIEPQDFEPEKFAELQSLSRKAAPKICDIIMRMKLEVPVDYDARSIMTRLSGPQSRPISPDAPPIPPLFPFSDMRKGSDSPAASVQRSAPESVAETRSVHDPPTVEAATAQLRHLMQTQSGPDEGLYADVPGSLRHGPPPVPPPIEPPPRPPSANPWDIKTPPQSREQRFPDDFSFERRAPVAPVESPIEPISPPLSPDRARESPKSLPRPLYIGADRSSQISNDSRLSPTGAEPSSYERTYNIFPTPRGRYSNTNSIMSTSIPEDVASDRSGAAAHMAQQLSSRRPPPRTHSLPKSRPESIETNQSPVFDHARTDGVSTPLTEHLGSAVSAADSSPTLGSSELSSLSLKAPPVNNYQGIIEPPQVVLMPEIDNLPIPVETETQTPVHPPNPFAVDCRLSPQSSFYTHKGFCDGAKEILNGGAGVKKTVKAVWISSLSPPSEPCQHILTHLGLRFCRFGCQVCQVPL